MRNNLGASLGLAIIVLCHCALLDAKSISHTKPLEQVLSQAARASNGRRCGLNVCFAYDGSRSLSNTEFQLEKNLIFDVTSILIDFPVSYSTVQYGRKIDHTQSLTTDVAPFILSLNGTRQSREEFSNISQGLRFCTRELRRRRGGINAIVVLTNGISGKGRISARQSQKFIRRGGELFVFGVGEPRDDDALTSIAGNDVTRVLESEDFFDTLSVTETLAELYVDKCGSTTVTNIEWPLEGES